MRLWEAGAAEAATRLEGRGQLLQHIADKLRPRGLTVTDAMIHLRRCGSPIPFAGASYAVMVDRYGLFGYADESGAGEADAPPERNARPDIDKAFDAPPSPSRKQDR